MRNLRPINLLSAAALLGVFACRRASTPGHPATASNLGASVPSLPCFSAESGGIAFGRMVTSSVDQDVSGLQFSFEVDSGRLRGYIRDAAGEVPPRRSLQDLHFDSTTDTLSFVFEDSPNDRSLYRYHVSCQRLTGGGRLFVAPTDTGVVVRDTLPRAAPIKLP